ncbi:thioesterase [Rhodobacteraceae bacterium]|nr:thioesterase [Paracoccaceae bacterium]
MIQFVLKHVSGHQYEMRDMEKLVLGLTGHAEMVVGSNDTAAKVGSGMGAVLATPIMINLVEAAALDATEHLLASGKQSLGTKLDISHIAATPVGMKVVATAVVDEVDGNRISYAVVVKDELELIAEGKHTRVTVSADKFQARVNKKANRP